MSNQLQWTFLASHQSIGGPCPSTSVEVLDGNIGVSPGDLDHVVVILQPRRWFSGAVIGLDLLVFPETLEVSCGPYHMSKATWSQVLSFPGLVNLVQA